MSEFAKLVEHKIYDICHIDKPNARLYNIDNQATKKGENEMNTSAREAQLEMIYKVEKLTNSKATFVDARDREQGIGTGNVDGYNFVINAGTNDARWIAGDEAIKQSNLRFAIFNKNNEEKISLQSFFQLKGKTNMLDFERKEYTVKVLPVK
jgi:hypothetical protein